MIPGTLFSIVLVATLTLIANISYFEYKFRKEGTKEILRQRLTQLLLPLYFMLKRDELEVHAWARSDADPAEYDADLPKRIMNKDLFEIISKYLYLADDELHTACLELIEWGYKSDTDERFQRVHEKKLEEDVTFENFRKIVYSKFQQAKVEYSQ